MVKVITIKPPAPSPWMARKAMSWVIDWDIPARTDPIKKVTMANWKTIFRPYMSDTFPYRGAEAVEVRR